MSGEVKLQVTAKSAGRITIGDVKDAYAREYGTPRAGQTIHVTGGSCGDDANGVGRKRKREATTSPAPVVVR